MLIGLVLTFTLLVLSALYTLKLKKELKKQAKLSRDFKRGAVEPIIADLTTRGHSLVLLQIDQDSVMLRGPRR